MIINTKNENETYEAGRKLAEMICGITGKKFVALYGDVGAGKTVFVRGMVSILSPSSRVKSPSYTIVNEYLSGSTDVYHFDFYRISSASELYFVGFDEYLEKGICLCEWCEKAEEAVPSYAVKVAIEKTGEYERKIKIDFPSET